MKCFNVRENGDHCPWVATLVRGTLEGHGYTAWAAIADLCHMMDEAEVDGREAHPLRLGDDLTSRRSG